jgi:primosomal protein N' (replication factor Y)
VLVSGVDEEQTRKGIESLAAIARLGTDSETNSEDCVELLGPAPAPLARLRGRFRYQLLVKSPPTPALDAILRRLAAAAARLPKPLRASVDVNPGNLL